MTAWVVVLAAGAGSFLFRVSIVGLTGRFETPTWLERAAGYVVPAAFATLAAAALADPVSQGLPEASAPLAATAVTATVARRSGSSQAAFLAGLVTLWLISAVAG